MLWLAFIIPFVSRLPYVNNTWLNGPVCDFPVQPYRARNYIRTILKHIAGWGSFIYVRRCDQEHAPNCIVRCNHNAMVKVWT